MEDPKAVALLAGLVRAFRAGDIEMCFDEVERVTLGKLSDEGLVDLSNDGFRLTPTGGSYAVRSQVPPVTAKGNSVPGASSHRRIRRPSRAVPVSWLAVKSSNSPPVPESSLA